MPRSSGARGGPDSLAKLIDAEIAHAVAENSRRGVSPWTLALALSGLFWALTSSSGVDLTNTLLVAVAAHAGLEFVQVLARTLGTSATTRASGRTRFRTIREIYACSGRCVATRVVTALATLAILGWLAPRHRLPHALIVIGAIREVALLAAVPIRSWVLARFDFAVAIDPPKAAPSDKRARIRNTLRAMFGGWTLLHLVFAIGAAAAVDVHGTTFPNDLRAGCLATAAAYVAQLLALASEQPPIVEALVRLRRRLVLESSDENEVAEELETLLLGADASRVLGGAVAPLLESISEVRRLLAAQRTELEKILRIEQKRTKAGRLADPEQHEQWDAAQRCKDLIGEHDVVLKTGIVPRERQYRLALAAVRLSGENDAVDAVERRVAAQLDDVKTEKELIRKRLEKALPMLPELASALQARKGPAETRTPALARGDAKS